MISESVFDRLRRSSPTKKFLLSDELFYGYRILIRYTRKLIRVTHTHMMNVAVHSNIVRNAFIGKIRCIFVNFLIIIYSINIYSQMNKSNTTIIYHCFNDGGCDVMFLYVPFLLQSTSIFSFYLLDLFSRLSDSLHLFPSFLCHQNIFFLLQTS